jgi:hypothetical protein
MLKKIVLLIMITGFIFAEDNEIIYEIDTNSDPIFVSELGYDGKQAIDYLLNNYSDYVSIEKDKVIFTDLNQEIEHEIAKAFWDIINTYMLLNDDEYTYLINNFDVNENDITVVRDEYSAYWKNYDADIVDQLTEALNEQESDIDVNSFNNNLGFELEKSIYIPVYGYDIKNKNQSCTLTATDLIRLEKGSYFTVYFLNNEVFNKIDNTIVNVKCQNVDDTDIIKFLANNLVVD